MSVDHGENWGVLCLHKYFGNFISHAKSIYLKNVGRNHGNTTEEPSLLNLGSLSWTVSTITLLTINYSNASIPKLTNSNRQSSCPVRCKCQTQSQLLSCRWLWSKVLLGLLEDKSVLCLLSSNLHCLHLPLITMTNPSSPSRNHMKVFYGNSGWQVGLLCLLVHSAGACYEHGNLALPNTLG